MNDGPVDWCDSCYGNVVVIVSLCLWCVVERLTWRLNHSRSSACVPALSHTHITTSLHETPTSVPWASRPWVRITHRHAISTVIMTSQRSLSNDLSHKLTQRCLCTQQLPRQDMLKPGKLQVFCSPSGSCQGLQNLVRARDLWCYLRVMLIVHRTASWTSDIGWQYSNNNDDVSDNVYSAVIIARPLWEFTRFGWWMPSDCLASDQANWLGLWVCL